MLEAKGCKGLADITSRAFGVLRLVETDQALSDMEHPGERVKQFFAREERRIMTGANGKPASLDELIGVRVAEAVREALSQTKPGRRLLTVAEAAEYLTVSRRYLANLTAAGDIPAVRMGRAVRYDVADLDAWIEQHKNVL